MRGTRIEIDKAIEKIAKPRILFKEKDNIVLPNGITFISDDVITRQEFDIILNSVFAVYDSERGQRTKKELQSILSTDISDLFCVWNRVATLNNKTDKNKYNDIVYCLENLMHSLLLRTNEIGIKLKKTDIIKYENSKLRFSVFDSFVSCIKSIYEGEKGGRGRTEDNIKNYVVDKYKDEFNKYILPVLHILFITYDSVQIVGTFKILVDKGYLKKIPEYMCIKREFSECKITNTYRTHEAKENGKVVANIAKKPINNTVLNELEKNLLLAIKFKFPDTQL